MRFFSIFSVILLFLSLTVHAEGRADACMTVAEALLKMPKGKVPQAVRAGETVALANAYAGVSPKVFDGFSSAEYIFSLNNDISGSWEPSTGVDVVKNAVVQQMPQQVKINTTPAMGGNYHVRFNVYLVSNAHVPCFMPVSVYDGTLRIENDSSSIHVEPPNVSSVNLDKAAYSIHDSLVIRFRSDETLCTTALIRSGKCIASWWTVRAVPDGAPAYYDNEEAFSLIDEGNGLFTATVPLSQFDFGSARGKMRLSVLAVTDLFGNHSYALSKTELPVFELID